MTDLTNFVVDRFLHLQIPQCLKLLTDFRYRKLKKTRLESLKLTQIVWGKSQQT